MTGWPGSPRDHDEGEKAQVLCSQQRHIIFFFTCQVFFIVYILYSCSYSTRSSSQTWGLQPQHHCTPIQFTKTPLGHEEHERSDLQRVCKQISSFNYIIQTKLSSVRLTALLLPLMHSVVKCAWWVKCYHKKIRKMGITMKIRPRFSLKQWEAFWWTVNMFISPRCRRGNLHF